ncbi:DHA2 family efflux MFS transporter permease subunit [Ruficoccus amylovorans]|uniref:DHA2 family efflux MFS transporter permease subunit n=1 Tax=Ruficoccus amylovorans TaxID=1804625 RepID=A0A842HB64_9BACT|nr:DHA2 family efflux MFS transporter permease subunit [Ruficoccus amylovorans]MBC2593379.1 DHA2 family efflux MFS transporter permease subunit [Ruficoccus amylovorans]
MDKQPQASIYGENGHPLRYVIVAVVTLASFLEGLDASIITVSLPDMMGTLDASLEQISWVSNGYLLANVIIIPMTGWLAQLFGRKRYFNGSLVLFTFASLMCGLSGSLTEIIIWRVLQGIGGGALVATAQAIIYEVFPPREHARAMSLWGLGLMVGPAMGPAIGGYITGILSWPWIFYVTVPFGALAVVMVSLVVPESPYREKVKKIDLQGLLLLTFAIGSLQYILVKESSLDWGFLGNGMNLAVLCAASAVMFVLRELNIPYPVVDLRILKNIQFTACCIFSFMQALCTLAIVFVTPMLLIDLMGFSALETGMIMFPVAAGTGLSMYIAGKVAHRINPYALILTGLAIFFFAMFKYSTFSFDTPKADLYLPFLLRGIGLGVIFVPLNALAVADLRPEQQANACGLLNLTRQFGSGVGIVIAASVLGKIKANFELVLANAVVPTQPASIVTMSNLERHFIALGVSPDTAQLYGLKTIEYANNLIASSLAFERIFAIFGLSLACVIPLLLLMRKQPASGKPTPARH